MKVAILGGGNSAHALAELALIGHQVNMCELPRFKENIAAAAMRKGVEITGKTDLAKEPGFAHLNMVTTNVQEAIKGVNVIIVAVPCFGQLTFIEYFANYLEDGQVIVFMPGNFASLVCAKYLKEKGINKEVIIAEAECFIYATRLRGPARAWIKTAKEKLGLAAFPATRTDEAVEVMQQLYPQIFSVDNVMNTGIYNINTILHPMSTMLDASRIERMGPFKNQHYGVTPSIGRVMERIDEEKMEISKALGQQPVSTAEILNRYYGATGNNLHETMENCWTMKSHTSPDSLKHRFITEDVPYGLVTMASLAKQLGTKHHALDTMINLAVLLNDENYWEIGRTVKDLGLEGMSSEEIIEFVTNGKTV